MGQNTVTFTRRGLDETKKLPVVPPLRVLHEVSYPLRVALFLRTRGGLTPGRSVVANCQKGRRRPPVGKKVHPGNHSNRQFGECERRLQDKSLGLLCVNALANCIQGLLCLREFRIQLQGACPLFRGLCQVTLFKVGDAEVVVNGCVVWP